MTETNVGIQVSGFFNESNYHVSNVIDGNANTNPKTCNCCFATNNSETKSWLQLDLRKKYLVYQIRVVGRTDGKYAQKMLNICKTLKLNNRSTLVY